MRIGILAVLTLLACDPDVALEDIPASRLLSVTCFLSPQDTVFEAFLFRGSELGSTVSSDSAAVKDAIVTISDGNNYDTLLLTYNVEQFSGRKKYKYACKRKNVLVLTNGTYTLQAATPNGVMVNGTCTIPSVPESLKISGIREGDDYRFVFNWNNNALHKYFVVIMDADGQYNNPFPGGGGTIGLYPVLLEDIKFPSDKQVVTNSYEGVLANAYLAENPKLMVSVRNLDEGLFNYFKSYRKYEDWNAKNSGISFPNFQEIPLLYSNIQGGVGIFGGFNGTSVEVSL